jgi:putative membrane protein
MSPEPRRLHRAAIGVFALNTLRQGAVPLIVVILLGAARGGFDGGALLQSAMWVVAGTAVSAALAGWRWATTTWWVDEQAIHLRTGMLGSRTTDVPLSRLQALDLEQGPIQRLFGVWAVHVQSGGGGARGEIVLDALTEADIEALRALVAGTAPAAAEVHEPDAVRRLSGAMLLVAALTAGQLGVILPVLAGAGQLLDNVIGNEREAVRLLPDAPHEFVLAAVALLLAAWLLSVAGAVVAFSGFTLARDGDRLRIRRGLVSHREATVPVDRVRAVEVVEGVIRLPFGLASVRMEVIGHADEPAAAQTLFPLVRRSEVRGLLDAFLPELADDLGPLALPPGRAARRYVVPPVALAVLVAALAWIFLPVGPWALALALPAAAYGLAQHRAAGWRLEGDRLVVRSLMLARRTLLAPARRRESHTVSQTVLQRRGDLADVAVAFGKSADARVRHLEAATATGLFDRLSRI